MFMGEVCPDDERMSYHAGSARSPSRRRADRRPADRRPAAAGPEMATPAISLGRSRAFVRDGEPRWPLSVRGEEGPQLGPAHVAVDQAVEGVHAGDGEVDRGARNVPGREPSRGLSESTLARAEGRDRVEDALDGCRSLGLIILQLIQGAERRGEERSVVVSELAAAARVSAARVPLRLGVGSTRRPTKEKRLNQSEVADEASDGGEACAGEGGRRSEGTQGPQGGQGHPCCSEATADDGGPGGPRGAPARAARTVQPRRPGARTSRAPGSPAIPPVKPSSSASRTVMAGALAPRLFSSSSMAPSPAWLARSPATARAIGSWRNRSANRRIPNTPIAAPDPAARAAARVVAPQADISTATTSAPLSQP